MMEVIVEYPTKEEDIKRFKEKVAYFKAVFLYHSVNKLNVSETVKNEIFKCLLDKMDDNERMIWFFYKLVARLNIRILFLYLV